MRRALFASFALSCASVDTAVLPEDPLPEGWLAEGREQIQGPAAFALVFSQDPLVPGTQVPFVVTGAAPGDLVRFLTSSAGTGAGPCPAVIGGLCLDLLAPVRQLGTAVADGVGTAELLVPVPVGAPQIFLFTQAVVDRGASSVKTNTITAPVLGGALDDDLDGYCDGAVCADPLAIPGDCDDTVADVNPAATAFQPLPYQTLAGPSFDYDCDGLEEVESVDEYRCNGNGGGPNCPSQDGWDFNQVPGCGQVGTFSVGCVEFPFLGFCSPAASDVAAVQGCR